MSLFHHDAPRVVIEPESQVKTTPQPTQEAAPAMSSAKEVYDAVQPSLAQHAQNEAPVGGAADVVANSDTAASHGESMATADPVQVSSPESVPSLSQTDVAGRDLISATSSEPVKPMIPPHTEVDVFGVPRPVAESTDSVIPAVSSGADEGKPAVDASVPPKYAPSEDSLVSEKPVSPPEDRVVSEYTMPSSKPEETRETPEEAKRWIEGINAKLEGLHSEIGKHQDEITSLTREVEELEKTKAAFENPEVALAVQYMEKNKSGANEESHDAVGNDTTESQQDSSPLS
jgi:hypothetical protein